MTAPKELKSTFRYFLARLKPFGRFIVWGPLGITLLLGLVLWQYLSHPELNEQPLETDNPTGSNLDSLDINPRDAQRNPGTDQIPLADSLKPKASPTTPSATNSKLGPNLQPDFFSQFTQPQKEQPQPQEGSAKVPTTKLFQPLLPQRSSVNSPTIAPANTTPNNLPDYQVTAEEDNPLKKALEREFANPSQTTTTTQSPSSLNLNNQPSISQPQLSNNNYGVQAVPAQPYTQPYQTPYNPYGGQVAQPQPQSYPPAYNPYNNPYNGQAPSQPVQSPYNNTYGGQVNPVSPNQVGNPYGTVTPQIQPSLEGTNY